MSKPPPPGIYVPAVLFFKEDEELDEEAIKTHVLRLAQVLTYVVQPTSVSNRHNFVVVVGICHWDPCSRIKRRGPTSLT